MRGLRSAATFVSAAVAMIGCAALLDLEGYGDAVGGSAPVTSSSSGAVAAGGVGGVVDAAGGAVVGVGGSGAAGGGGGGGTNCQLPVMLSPTCQSCLDTAGSCCFVIAACNASTECTAYLACVEQNGVAGCDMGSPGQQLADAVGSCVGASGCADQCTSFCAWVSPTVADVGGLMCASCQEASCCAVWSDCIGSSPCVDCISNGTTSSCDATDFDEEVEMCLGGCASC